MATNPFNIQKPHSTLSPIIISVPHCGILIPEQDKRFYQEEILSELTDTDWVVDELYNFAPSMGITLISANYSRYVIDLNRDPHGGSLYTDGRKETQLAPSYTFDGKPIYKFGFEVHSQITDRIKNYFDPYHQALTEQLTALMKHFKHVLLFDAHSIRRYVSSINKEPFQDLILGSNDGKSASKSLIDSALKTLAQSQFSVSHNHPFKGGYITRSFGKPENKIHALQLEMSQDIYLDESSKKIALTKATVVRNLLREMLDQLLSQLKAMDKP